MNHHIRNVAIIAHVDHGKTTLVDGLLKQAGAFRAHEQVQECVMDSNDLERERGITILAKNTAISYGEHKVNIVDTPGHADFGGEVERVLGMVDGCLLLVDAFEGPMPQTRFVLRKALEQGLKPILVVNKIDRDGADPARAVDRVLDLFIELGADDDQIEFPVIYASGIGGYAIKQLEDERRDLTPLFEAILHHVPPPLGDEAKPLQLQVTTLDYSEYLGRIVIGRIHNGAISQGENLVLITADGTHVRGKVSKLFSFSGLKRLDVERASAGDIVAVAGFPEANIGETLASASDPHPLPLIRVDEPTMQIRFSVNDSPFAGREGKFVTSRQLRDRLNRELESNVALRVEETDSPDTFLLSGRGELHLGVLFETMRREGYEFQIGKPKVINRDIDGVPHEPFETLVLDVPDWAAGSCIERMGSRRGMMQHMHSDGTRTLVEFLIPARGLIGFRSDFIRMTKGEGILSHSFFDYQPHAGEIGQQRNGVMIAWEDGEATAYSIQNFEDRGVFFIKPGTKVYSGMLVGEHNRLQDLDVNVCKAKKLTNMRSAGAEVLTALQVPIEMTLERSMEYIADDELVEVTPQSIRLRKAKLSRHDR
ncbi:MAG: translational GTPase TypA [Candidatus Sericytochromatia bacterium]|nr:translational GTPase TypA [Candidatus Sericytochromatia bacterium]